MTAFVIVVIVVALLAVPAIVATAAGSLVDSFADQVSRI